MLKKAMEVFFIVISDRLMTGCRISAKPGPNCVRGVSAGLNVCVCLHVTLRRFLASTPGISKAHEPHI